MSQKWVTYPRHCCRLPGFSQQSLRTDLRLAQFSAAFWHITIIRDTYCIFILVCIWNDVVKAHFNQLQRWRICCCWATSECQWVPRPPHTEPSVLLICCPDQSFLGKTELMCRSNPLLILLPSGWPFHIISVWKVTLRSLNTRQSEGESTAAPTFVVQTKYHSSIKAQHHNTRDCRISLELLLMRMSRDFPVSPEVVWWVA